MESNTRYNPQQNLNNNAYWNNIFPMSYTVGQTRAAAVPPTNTFIPQNYTYPKPKPRLERKESKTEINELQQQQDALNGDSVFDFPSKTLVPESNKLKSKGNRCGGCNKLLGGKVIPTATKFWHSDCFKCQNENCQQKLEHIEYYEKDGQPYCALDFHEMFSPRCDHCKTPIEADKRIIVFGKYYHFGHFFCRQCGHAFSEEDIILEKDGHGYCEKDYNRLFAKTCKGCGEYISHGFIKALDGNWHSDCFACIDCGSKITSTTFKLKGGMPHCGNQCNNNLKTKKNQTSIPEIEKEINSLILNDTEQDCKVCHRCKKEIRGRFQSAFGHDYHPFHFQCSQCDKVLTVRLTGLYQEQDNEIVCKNCIRKLNQHY